ncbi:hypothetical protein FACS1894198_3970 [Clostridia bacterium]|nr:hypothetical protein FACS1894198_3970 [Clostridia bacterium]
MGTEKTILKMLDDFSVFGDKVAIKHFDDGILKEVIYSKLKKDILKFTAVLENVETNSRQVAILGSNSYAWLVSFFSIINAGFIVIPVGVLKHEVETILKNSSCTLITYSKSSRGILEKTKQNFPNSLGYVCVEEALESSLIDNQLPRKEISECAVIYYTSGSHGKPKGVMLSQTNIMLSVNAVISNLDSFKSMLALLPLYHIGGLAVGILPALRVGGTAFIGDEASDFLNDLKLFRPDAVFLVPLLVEKLLKEIKKGSVATLPKQVISGGAHLNPALIKEFKEFGIDLLNAYGLTECGPVVSFSNSRNIKVGSAGKIVAGCQVKLSEGEILVKGPNVMLGYYNDQAETDRTVVDGWLKTGDLGHLDSDGFVHLTGRKKNVIVLKNGEKVAPEELEMMINSILYVKECVVKAVRKDNENIALAADVVLDDVYLDEKEYDISLIFSDIKELNKRLPYGQKIRKVNICDRFEKTNLLKIKRDVCDEFVSEG